VKVVSRMNSPVTATEQILAVVLDYGNVLSLLPSETDIQEVQRLTGIARETLEELFWRYRDDYDRGGLDGRSYWRKVGAAAGKQFVDGDVDNIVVHDAAMWSHINPAMMNWVRALKREGLKTALLSNMPMEVSAYLRRTADWLGDFDCLVFSGEHKTTKPDPAIYRVCLDGLGVRPHNALFVDDSSPNVLGAQAVGMRTVQFHSVTQLASAVRPFGLSNGLVAS